MYLQKAKPIYNVIVFSGRPEATPRRLALQGPRIDVQSINCISWPKMGKEEEQL